MSARIHERLTVAASLPPDAGDALLVGRVFVPAVEGPVLVRVVGDDLLDLSTIASISSELLDRADAIDAIRKARLPRIGSLAAALANAAPAGRDTAAPWLLAPGDLQAIKAAGVTFVASMLERVIEEQARGDPGKASAPGSPASSATTCATSGRVRRKRRASRTCCWPRGCGRSISKWALVPTPRSSPSRSRCRR